MEYELIELDAQSLLSFPTSKLSYTRLSNEAYFPIEESGDVTFLLLTEPIPEKCHQLPPRFLRKTENQ